MKWAKSGKDHAIDKLLNSGHSSPVVVITGDHVKYAEIMVRLGVTMLKLAMAGFDGDELRRLTDEATKQALGRSKNPESRCIWNPRSAIGRLRFSRINRLLHGGYANEKTR